MKQDLNKKDHLLFLKVYIDTESLNDYKIQPEVSIPHYFRISGGDRHADKHTLQIIHSTDQEACWVKIEVYL